jgi:hypothetical protein
MRIYPGTSTGSALGAFPPRSTPLFHGRLTINAGVCPRFISFSGPQKKLRMFVTVVRADSRTLPRLFVPNSCPTSHLCC